MSDGLDRSVGLLQRHPEMKVRFSVRRVETEGSLQVMDGLDRPVQSLIDVAQLRVDRPNIGPDRQRRAVAANGFHRVFLTQRP